jgi:hypothetical protein
MTAFWTDMARKLFWNVNALYEQIETHYADRTPDEGPGAQMAVRANNPERAQELLDANVASAGVLCLQLWIIGVLSVQVPRQ